MRVDSVRHGSGGPATSFVCARTVDGVNSAVDSAVHCIDAWPTEDAHFQRSGGSRRLSLQASRWPLDSALTHMAREHCHPHRLRTQHPTKTVLRMAACMCMTHDLISQILAEAFSAWPFCYISLRPEPVWRGMPFAAKHQSNNQSIHLPNPPT